MTNRNNNLVFEMIDEVESDDIVKDVMKKIFSSEIRHSNSNSASKIKVTYCRELIEKVVK